MLAEVSDLAGALDRDISDTEGPRAELLLRAAGNAVASRTGYRFETGDYTITRLVRSNGRVPIPATDPTVTEVRTLTDGETALVDPAVWRLHRGTLHRLPAGEAEIDFTVTSPVPAEIVDLVVGVAAATLGGPGAGVESQTTGPFSVSYVDSSGRVWFSKSDLLILAKYSAHRRRTHRQG